MFNKLVQFYEGCILPELLDPRQERNMPIRDPEYIIETKRRKMTEKKDRQVKAGVEIIIRKV